jgi:S-adenosylmethionine hydrolase
MPRVWSIGRVGWPPRPSCRGPWRRVGFPSTWPLRGGTVRAVTRSIVFLSDLGIRDESVGVCHAVIDRIVPGARVVDLGHGVNPVDIWAGAIGLLQALPYVDPGAVVLAVIDPGSGTDRLALALRTAAGRLMVGPDNGVLSLAWAADGGVADAVHIDAPDVLLSPVSPVLHARDVFAPAAAHLAAGRALGDLGRVVDPDGLVTIRLAEPDVAHRRVGAEVLDIDRFGNVRLNVKPQHLVAAGLDPDETLELGTAAAGARARRITTYGQVGAGECGALEDAWGWISIIRFGASAADLLGVRVGDQVQVAAAD